MTGTNLKDANMLGGKDSTALALLNNGTSDTDRFMNSRALAVKAIFELRGKEDGSAERAMGYAKEANEKDRAYAWGWVARYLAAKELKDDKEASVAYEGWRTSAPVHQLPLLNRLVPDLLRKHLNFRVFHGHLHNDSSTTKSGKDYPVVLDEGKEYVVDLESSAFDSYLILKDESDRNIRFDDDGGGYPNARLWLRDLKGNYQVRATSLGYGGQGPYTLIIREAPYRQKAADASKK